MNDKEIETGVIKLTKKFAKDNGLDFDTDTCSFAIKETISQFKPKAGEVEKLKEKFKKEYQGDVDPLCKIYHEVWQWIQDNCLSKAKEVDKQNVLYEFYLHDGSLLYSCKTEEKKNIYERGLKSKRVKYTIKELGKKEVGENLCYKTGAACLYGCNGLCKESC